ncbi:hypothetical protein [Cupriavidus gilardii]|uniref:Uncharacterized protein n=1 Tax=Cupriavidus gilardii TaxID=82541 RepID=A0ABY4VPX9_9BURK|nr:hypothetical protein [Cupriavidus gilardii]NSX04830.1 hypothetical protein [Cupriavidus gilardii]USE78089.1 hypothetical protein NDR89_03310 [Cupriavidus gilardii]
MPLPSFRCPVCRNTLTLDVVFAHDGVREAILQLINAHPAASKLLRPLLGYVGLFAPAKTEMRYERVAAILAELVPMIQAGTVKDVHGREWPAPMDYWCQGFDQMLAQRDAGSLRLPLKSHGYLCAVVAGLSDRKDAVAERHIEAQRAGHAGAGTPASRMQPVTVAEPAARAAIPDDLRKEILRAAGSRRADAIGDHK